MKQFTSVYIQYVITVGWLVEGKDIRPVQINATAVLKSLLCRASGQPNLNYIQQDAMLSQGGPHDAAVNFGTHMKFTAASHSFCCDSNAFELNNSKVMAK